MSANAPVAARQERELREVPVSEINVVVQARTLDAEHVGNLKTSIKKEGLLSPVTVYVRGGTLILGPGQHRLAAVKALGWSAIPAYVLPDADDRTIELHQLIENVDRLSMNPIEEAMSCERLLKDYAGPHARFAADLGKTPRWLDERLSLLRLSERVQQFVADRSLPLAHALLIAQIADHAQQEEIAASARGGSHIEKDDARPLSIKKTRALVEKHLRVLDDVSWQLDVAFGGKPACASCPHNSRNVPELFADKEGNVALCLDNACFKEKSKAASTGTRQVVNKLKRSKTIEDAVSQGPTVFEEALRDFKVEREANDEDIDLDPTERAAEQMLADERKNASKGTAPKDLSAEATSVRKLIEQNAVAGAVRDVKADYLKPTALHHAASVAVDPSKKTDAERKGDRTRQGRSKIEKEWVETRDKWNRGAQQLVGAELRRDPLRLALYTLLMTTRTAAVLLFDLNRHVEPTKEQADALNVMLERLQMLKNPTASDLEKAAKILVEDQPDVEFPFSHHETPSNVTVAVADTLGVELSPLPTMESLEAKRNAEVQRRNTEKSRGGDDGQGTVSSSVKSESDQLGYGKKSKIPSRKKKRAAAKQKESEQA